MRTTLTICLVLLTLAGCYKETDFDLAELTPANVIVELSSSKPSLLANNTDKAMITVRLPDDAKEGVDILLKTSKGVFTSNNLAEITVKSTIKQREGVSVVVGEAELKNGLSDGTIHITATVAGVSLPLDILSAYNYPNGLSLTASSLALQRLSTAEVELSVQLNAEHGTVTEGHPVQLLMLNANSTDTLGSFRIREDRSDATGKCRFVYSLVPDTLYTGGLLHAIATSATDSGTVSTVLDLYVIN